MSIRYTERIVKTYKSSLAHDRFSLPELRFAFGRAIQF